MEVAGSLLEFGAAYRLMTYLHCDVFFFFFLGKFFKAQSLSLETQGAFHLQIIFIGEQKN